MRQQTRPLKEPAEKVVQDIRRATRKHYSAEEKIRIVLEGLRGANFLSGIGEIGEVSSEIRHQRPSIFARFVGFRRCADEACEVHIMRYDLSLVFRDPRCFHNACRRLRQRLPLRNVGYLPSHRRWRSPASVPTKETHNQTHDVKSVHCCKRRTYSNIAVSDERPRNTAKLLIVRT